MRGRFAEDLTGKRFGILTVIGRAPNRVLFSSGGRKHQTAMWFCQCDCQSNPKAIRAEHLRSGRVISCGCLGREHSRAAKIKHDGRHDRLYCVWYNMRQRCRNPKIRCYPNYGGRGIRVCEEWDKDYGAFRKWAYENGYDENAAYGKCTIDRIDVNGDYEPKNCRWADAVTQARNKRRAKEKCATQEGGDRK